MSTVPPSLSLEASNALFLASTAAWSMSGKSLADPETQHLRRQALDNMEIAKRLLENVGPPLDTEPYRLRVAESMEPTSTGLPFNGAVPLGGGDPA
ncbi:MAG: hypothetical protein IMZ55_10300 [Acidobacteria bacterium]|nr:hypothetical protein [Acidobacteriota bacterium]